MFYDDHGKERNGIVFALKAQCKDFDAKFGEIKTRFGQHLSSLEKRRGMVNTLKVASLHSEVDGISKMLKDNRGERFDQAERTQQDERRRRFLECLPCLNFEEIQENNHDRLVPGSGNWLLNDDEFLAWQNSPKSSLLWVHGRPGTGKSHLATRVIRELRSSSCAADGAALAYAYCTNTQTKTRMNLNNLLGSILKQLYRQLPLSQSVETLSSRVDDSSKEEPPRSEMMDGIRMVVSKLHSSHIIIDGLDECSHFPDHQFGDFCAFLASLAESKDSKSATRVLVFSRPNYKAINDAFSRFPRLQVDAGANDSDIKAYISHKVDEINTDPSAEESIGFGEIKNLMFSNAAGLFLWVHFKAMHFKEIGSVEDIKEALQDSTGGLDELYGGEIRKILENPSRFIRDRALRALLWVTNSYRPLSKLELLEALSMKPGRKTLNQCQRLPKDISLTRDCADLITEVDGYYQLRHASLRDFLSSRLPVLLAYGDLQNCAHPILAETCLTYINFQDFDGVSVESPEELAELQAKYPLLEYASLHWGDHFVEGNENRSEPLCQLLTDFLTKQTAMRLSIQILELRAFRDGLRSPGKPSALHILAIFNLSGIVKSRNDLEGSLRIQDEFGHSPIEYSMLYGRREMTRWLLDEHLKEHEDGQPFSPAILQSCRAWLLHSAAEENWDDVVRDLITLGFDPNTRDLAGESPVHAAAKASANSSLRQLLQLGGSNDSRSLQRHTPLTLAALHMNSEGVDILLRSGACVSQPGKNDETALHHAAKFGLVDMALNILSYGADVNAPCSFEPNFYGETPLHYAVVARMAEMVQLLIQHGARLEVETTAGDTPISLACCFGLTRIFEILSKNGADLAACNPRNRSTVLHRAAEHGNLHIIEAILASPAHESLINAIDSSGNTPLLVALYQGQSEVATLLLERGAKPDVVNFNQSTPLHVAIDSECIDVAKKLLATSKMGLRTPGQRGNTILHGIAAKGRTDLLPLILQQDGNHVLRNDDGFTPLHFAAAYDRADFIRELMKLCPSVKITSGNNRDTTPLHTAARQGSIETVKLLVKLNSSLVDCRDGNSRLPLHSAAAFGHAHCVAELFTAENIDSQDDIGATPLWLASRNGHYGVVQKLITAGANLDTISHSGLPPVSVAMAKLHHHIANLLMDSGAKGNITGNDGVSSVQLAARTGNKRFFEQIYGYFIVDSDSEIQRNENSGAFAVDTDGKDLMGRAAEGGHAHMVDCLLELRLPIDGLGQSLSSPLSTAARHGFVDFVFIAVSRGALIRNMNYRWDERLQRDALIQATLKGRTKTMQILLAHGGDPTARDCFGQCAIDYAVKQGTSSAIFEPWMKKTYCPLDQVIRITKSKRMIAEFAQEAMAETPDADSRFWDRRYQNLTGLSLGLLSINTPTSNYQARLCRIEIAERPSDGWLICDACDKPVSSPSYQCTVCEDMDFCQACYQDYWWSTPPQTVPEHFKALWVIEDDVRPVLRAAEIFHTHGVEGLPACLQALGDIAEEWIDTKLAAYSAWSRNCASWKNDLSQTAYGLQFVNLLDVARKFQWNDPSKGNSMDVASTKQLGYLKQEIWEIFARINPRSEPRRPACNGHTFIEVVPYKRLSTAEQEHFDGQGMLNRKFFQDLAEQYAVSSTQEEDENLVGARKPKTAVTYRNDNVPGAQDSRFSAITSEECMQRLRIFRQKLLREVERFHLANTTLGSEKGLNREQAVLLDVGETSWKLAQAMLGVCSGVLLADSSV